MFSEQGVAGDRVMGFTYLDDNVPPDFKAVLDSLGTFNIHVRVKQPKAVLMFFMMSFSSHLLSMMNVFMIS